MNTKDSEIYYCTHCGAANKKSAVECVECEKKIISKYRPFYDFLKNHTKEEGKDTAVNTVLGVLYRFLVSHIYGIVLTVSIVAAGVATVQGFDSHIKDVSEAPKANIVAKEEQEEEIKGIDFELTDDDLYDFEYLASYCDAFADRLRASYGYWNQDDMDYSDASEMYAQNNIEDFDYIGAHEMLSNPQEPLFLLSGAEPDYQYECRHLVPSSALSGGECTTEIAKKLYADGYKVAECNYMLNIGMGEHDADTHTGGTDVRRLVYKFVFVENNDEWYIVEDRLLENYSV